MSRVEAPRTREHAVAELRAVFAAAYNELRARGHDVIVEYDEPGNPLYIPQIVELDGLNRAALCVRFYIEPLIKSVGGLKTRLGFDYGVLYTPTWIARNSYCERQKSRSFSLTPNQLSGPSLAAWIVKLWDVEHRSHRIAIEHHKRTCNERS